MRKLALHWQILIALLLAILYGLYFSTNYIITTESLETLSKQKVSEQVIGKVKTLEGNEYLTMAEFDNALEQYLSKDQIDEYHVKLVKSAYSNPALEYVSWMGDIFMRALKMLIIPLILSSLISGITNIGSGANLGRLGGKTLLFYISTSFFAIITGQILVNIIKPGVGAQVNFIQEVEGLVEKQRGFKEILIEIIPENIFTAMTENNMLQIIFFALIFGFFITKAGKKHSELLQQFFTSIFEVMMKVTLFVIKFTPLGIFGLVAKTVADQDDFAGLVSSMGLYMFTVIIALGIHGFVTLPLIVKFIGKAKPYQHLKNMTTPLLTAFSTSSSAATLPLTINAVEEKSGVSNKISSFTLPLGATVNMDGTALYECIAAIFIAQAYGLDLSFVDQLIIVLTALLASIGAAAIPMAGLVMMTVILTAIGLPLEGIGLIIAVDRILDMFRTATNVWSDSCGAVVIAKTEGEKLKV